MNSEQLIALDSESVMQTYGRFPLALDHGEGATLYSPEGKAYIDFTSGIGVNCLGYGNKNGWKPFPPRRQSSSMSPISITQNPTSAWRRR